MSPRFDQLELDAAALNHTAHHWLAFSGGPDSLCLLHQLLASGMENRLTVVHVDHGLDTESTQRARQAEALAHNLGIECRVERLSRDDLDLPGGPEAAARHARYARLQKLMSPDDYLLTAHHADDQIETLLLRMLRGSGARGLSGMQPIRPLPPGWLARPLLHWTRQQILEYLDQHELSAIDDPTNRDCSLDRNYLRQQVLPRIAKHWPHYRTSLINASALMAAAGRAFEAQAAHDFKSLCRNRAGEDTIALNPWLELEAARALEVIRHWCRTHRIQAPPAARLHEFLNQCQSADSDRQPTLDWHEARLRRWSGALWLDRKPEPPVKWQLNGHFDDAHELNIDLPHHLGRLVLPVNPANPPGENWQIDSGQPGDQLQVDSLSRSVSELMRSAGIPPWRRAHWPRLRIDGRLIAVGDRWLDGRFNKTLKQQSAGLDWKKEGQPRQAATLEQTTNQPPEENR